MSPGSHAADDGSFGRSAGIQAGRAALLIGGALLVGVILLHRSPSASGGGVPVAVGTGTTRAAATHPSTTVGHTTGTTGHTTGTTARSSATTTTTVMLRAPQDIKVLVANGTSVPGLAGKVSNIATSKGYDTLASANATTKPTSSAVYFTPGYSADAASLAGKLGLPASAVQTIPTPPPVQNLNGAEILVVAGPDLANAASTTPTT